MRFLAPQVEVSWNERIGLSQAGIIGLIEGGARVGLLRAYFSESIGRVDGAADCGARAGEVI